MRLAFCTVPSGRWATTLTSASNKTVLKHAIHNPWRDPRPNETEFAFSLPWELKIDTICSSCHQGCQNRELWSGESYESG